MQHAFWLNTGNVLQASLIVLWDIGSIQFNTCHELIAALPCLACACRLYSTIASRILDGHASSGKDQTPLGAVDRQIREAGLGWTGLRCHEQRDRGHGDERRRRRRGRGRGRGRGRVHVRVRVLGLCRYFREGNSHESTTHKMRI